MVEIRRWRCAERQALAGRRVDEGEGGSVQRQAPGIDGVSGRVTVDTVPEDRVAEKREMNADLMCAAGPELRFDQRRAREMLQGPHHCVSRTPAGARGERGSPGARPRTADSPVDQRLLAE
jgi:hypothetical protein